MKKALIALILGTFIAVPLLTQAGNLASRLEGTILLAVEDHGKTFYVHEGKRYRVTKDTAHSIFEQLALGITDADLALIPEGDVGIDPEATIEVHCGDCNCPEPTVVTEVVYRTEYVEVPVASECTVEAPVCGETYEDGYEYLQGEYEALEAKYDNLDNYYSDLFVEFEHIDSYVYMLERDNAIEDMEKWRDAYNEAIAEINDLEEEVDDLAHYISDECN